jgi:hypothetical protein
MTGVSIRPSGFVEGGAVPVDRNLLWKECRFAKFDYTTKAGEVVASTCAARITYQDDDGTEYIQHYSAADLARFEPSADGKTLVAVGNAQALSKSSNFYVLMNQLINAGFPENKLDADISTLDGLYTHNIGIPEPKRSGLVRKPAAEGTTEREKVLSVPDQILKLPWENKGKAAKTATKERAQTVEDEGDASADAIAMVTAMLADAESVTRQQVAAKAIRSKNQPVAKLVFSPKFAEALANAGFSLSGENITAG